MLRRRVRGPAFDDGFPFDVEDPDDDDKEVTLVETPRTPRGTLTFTPPRSVDRSGWVDPFLLWFHRFPVGFAILTVMSFLSRFWRVSGPSLPLPAWAEVCV